MVAGIVRAIEHNALRNRGHRAGCRRRLDSGLHAGGRRNQRTSAGSRICCAASTSRGQNGAQVVNMALVGPPNPLLRRAMDRLDQLGVLLVAAVGNEGRRRAALPGCLRVRDRCRCGRREGAGLRARQSRSCRRGSRARRRDHLDGPRRLVRVRRRHQPRRRQRHRPAGPGRRGERRPARRAHGLLPGRPGRREARSRSASRRCATCSRDSESPARVPAR